MGCSPSQDDQSKNSCHENMLASVLSNCIEANDYLARSHKLLDELTVDQPQKLVPGTDKVFMDINNAFMMLEPGAQPLEHGYSRQSDGQWFIAVNTDLGTLINGEMFDWWFRNCTDTERYKWWHPKDHKTGDWDPQFFSVQPEDRKAGYYVNHAQKVTQIIAGKLQTLQIEYDRPSKYFDISEFDDAGVTACIVARVHLVDGHGLSGIAHILHMVREVDGRSELRSRIWLGDYNRVDDNSVLPVWAVNSLGNSKIFRYTKAPAPMVKSMWTSLFQEMQCLRRFLPHFYDAECERQANLPAFGLADNRSSKSRNGSIQSNSPTNSDSPGSGSPSNSVNTPIGSINTPRSTESRSVRLNLPNSVKAH